MQIISKKKFSTLTVKRKHKHAALLLKEIFSGDTTFIDGYKFYEANLCLPNLIYEKKNILDRIYLHESRAGIPYKLQYQTPTNDLQANNKFLDIDIYLENLRSMHNIGAIMRTNEAFRLGRLHLSRPLPSNSLASIYKTSMGTEKYVPIHVTESISSLNQPIIAIETGDDATSCNDFIFPETFTLLFGNEQYGLSDQALSLANHKLHIPLYGNKHSINVSSAFAIIANLIRNSRKKYCQK